MTEIQDISLDQAGSDLLEVAGRVSEYKIENGGDSQLQTRADRINLGIGVVSSSGAGLATAGLSTKYQIAVGLATGGATTTVVKVSPEGLGITYKFEKTPIDD